MQHAVKADMRKSMRFVRIAQPIIQKLMGGGQMMAVEGDENEVCRMLDMTCGTDYFHVFREKGLVWGVASRIQDYDPRKGHKPFNTFTIRKARASGAATEYEKRVYAIKSRGVYPFLTMQAYVNTQSGEVQSLALCKTTDLMDYVERGFARERHTGAEQRGQAAFFYASWDDMARRGYKVLRFDAA